ncbi:MAG: PD40 domain-containing protein, partial [Caldilineaceae bacterium]|nr:PD40 domain-containing protein [Caldilineaceae bacterium]
DPNYLNGFATVQLYTAYLSLGDQAMQRKDRTSARSFFDSASALPVEDKSAVQRRLASLAGLPLPTRPPVEIATGPIIEPTPTLLPLVVPEAAFTPTPTPRPTVAIPDTLPAELANKIVFLSDRSGYPEVYLMDPVSGAIGLITEPWVHAVARKTLAVAPDGRREAIVQEDQSRILQIKVYDPEYNATQQITAISDKENESAIAYDPAWSPTGRQIAYVSTESRGDEIYTADLETGVIRRLTDNAWEWDKHPSFSPDGSQIVFYSNRETGRKQLWIMNADGTNQRNLSRNEYNDWDPIWTR